MRGLGGRGSRSAGGNHVTASSPDSLASRSGTSSGRYDGWRTGSEALLPAGDPRTSLDASPCRPMKPPTVLGRRGHLLCCLEREWGTTCCPTRACPLALTSDTRLRMGKIKRVWKQSRTKPHLFANAARNAPHRRRKYEAAPPEPSNHLLDEDGHARARHPCEQHRRRPRKIDGNVSPEEVVYACVCV